MKKTLFICGANIARSQMAEGYYNYLAGKNLAISAGVEADKYFEKFNGHPTPEAIEVMKEDGVNISKQMVKQFQKEMINKVDRVVMLCSEKTCPQELLEGAKEIVYAHVSDPYLQPIEKVREARNEIRELVKKLLKD